MVDMLNHLIADCRKHTHGGRDERDGPQWGPSDVADIGELLEELRAARAVLASLPPEADVPGLVAYRNEYGCRMAVGRGQIWRKGRERLMIVQVNGLEDAPRLAALPLDWEDNVTIDNIANERTVAEMERELSGWEFYGMASTRNVPDGEFH